MYITRRSFNQSLVSSAIVMTSMLGNASSLSAQTATVRLPLHEFVENEHLLNALRRGVKAMKKRKPSDPLSWFFQAAIHGVTNRMVFKAAQEDPDVLNFGFEGVWNQCPHFGQSSANFLPWHRAYTYHFEAILRMHAEEENFALPYWDYSIDSQRTFPREFGVKHLDGDVSNEDEDNINPLFHEERDFFLCGYEHPFTDQLPLTELSMRATDASRALTSPVFFGDTEATGLGGGEYDDESSTRGLLEQAPHDQIHRAVGGSVTGTSFPPGRPGTTIGGMAIPMTAGFDPIFPVHHTNIDRLWMLWSCSPGKMWGKLPRKSWFDEAPWTFFDTEGRPVVRPRKDYFDHRALGIRFKDEDMSCTPLRLPDELLAEPTVASTAPRLSSVATVRSRRSLEVVMEMVVSPETSTALSIVPAPQALLESTIQFMNALSAGQDDLESIMLVIHDVEIDAVSSNGFDVYLVGANEDIQKLDVSHEGYLGTISLFVHSTRDQMKFEQFFDATRAFRAAGGTLDDLQIVFVPYSLTSVPSIDNLPRDFGSNNMKASGIEIIMNQ